MQLSKNKARPADPGHQPQDSPQRLTP